MPEARSAKPLCRSRDAAETFSTGHIPSESVVTNAGTRTRLGEALQSMPGTNANDWS